MPASAEFGQRGSDSMNTNTSMTLSCPSRFDGVVIPFLDDNHTRTQSKKGVNLYLLTFQLNGLLHLKTGTL